LRSPAQFSVSRLFSTMQGTPPMDHENNPLFDSGHPKSVSRQGSLVSLLSDVSNGSAKTKGSGAGGELSSRLKTTCVSCVHSKIKCTGGDLTHPCERCKTRGFQCVFELEKKRGRRSVARTGKPGTARQRKAKRSCGAAVCWGEVSLFLLFNRCACVCEDFLNTSAQS
jgi:hypothetical protein